MTLFTRSALSPLMIAAALSVVSATVAFAQTQAPATKPQAPAAQPQTPAPATQPESTLPGGASSLQEAYQDWQVACGMTQAGKICSMSQVQQQQNGQRLLAIELRPSKDSAGKDGGAAGVLALPFGLKLDDGASLKVDTGADIAKLRFSTCLPAGCLLPLSFTAVNVATLKTGTNLTVTASSIDAAQPLALPISLKGFAQALDRLSQLSKQ